MAGERTDDGRSTVLVVDEPDAADRYSGWLAGRYDVRTASDVEEAVESLRDDPDAIDAIDAVLLNRRTSGPADDRVLVSIRNAGIDCPVALVTDGRPDVDGGFDDYLTEPVSKGALLRGIGSLLSVEGRESLRRELSAKRVRRNVLRLENSPAELAGSEAFARLEREIDALKRRLSLHRERLETREEREEREQAVGT